MEFQGTGTLIKVVGSARKERLKLVDVLLPLVTRYSDERKSEDRPEPSKPEIVKIVWGSVKDDTSCSYTYMQGESPLGNFLITWKGWKDHPGMFELELPFGEDKSLIMFSLEDAKQKAQERFEEAISKCTVG
jgi:hypothetical protein